jgi:hypothetical protein
VFGQELGPLQADFTVTEYVAGPIVPVQSVTDLERLNAMTYCPTPQEVGWLEAEANAVTQAAIAAGQELIDCSDGKKRTAAEKQAWEQHIWEQLRQVQG